MAKERGTDVEGMAEKENDIGIYRRVCRDLPAQETDVRAYSPLALAYIGDGIYELVVRSAVTARGNRSSEELSRMVVRYVRAGAQARMAEHFLEKGLLTEEEENVYKRGRNAHTYTKAKNATLADYKKATGFEALVGWLYLRGEDARMLTLIREGMRRVDNTETS